MGLIYKFYRNDLSVDCIFHTHFKYSKDDLILLHTHFSNIFQPLIRISFK